MCVHPRHSPLICFEWRVFGFVTYVRTLIKIECYIKGFSQMTLAMSLAIERDKYGKEKNKNNQCPE